MAGQEGTDTGSQNVSSALRHLAISQGLLQVHREPDLPPKWGPHPLPSPLPKVIPGVSLKITWLDPQLGLFLPLPN